MAKILVSKTGKIVQTSTGKIVFGAGGEPQWIDPVKENEKLKVVQVYNATQSGAKLSIQ